MHTLGERQENGQKQEHNCTVLYCTIIFTHTYSYVFSHTHIYTHRSTAVEQPKTGASLHNLVPTFIFTHTYIYVHMYTRMYIHIGQCIHTHIYLRTYVHTHVYTHRSMAVERPKTGASLQGLVLHNNFQLTICSMDEMSAHAGLQVSV